METEFRVTDVGVISRLDQRPCLQDISFIVKRGERLGVVGSTGAGKTSLLKALNRLVEIQQGTIHFRDQPLETYPVVTLRQQVLFVSELPALLGMTVAQALQYPLLLRGIAPELIQTQITEGRDRCQIPQEWLSLNEINLSMAQRQWVSLARALIANPSVLLLDAPFTHLNNAQAEQLLPLLQHFAGTVLVVSQSPQKLQAMCDRILWLDQGRIRHLSAPDQMDWENLAAQIDPDNTAPDDW